MFTCRACSLEGALVNVLSLLAVLTRVFQVNQMRSFDSDVVVDMVVSFSSLPLGVERQALHTPSPAASSTTAAGTSEEEGLHTALFLTLSRWPSCSSPGTSEEEGLAPLPSSSHCRWVLRRKRDRPSSSQRPPVPRRRKDRPSSSHRRCVPHASCQG